MCKRIINLAIFDLSTRKKQGTKSYLSKVDCPTPGQSGDLEDENSLYNKANLY